MTKLCICCIDEKEQKELAEKLQDFDYMQLIKRFEHPRLTYSGRPEPYIFIRCSGDVKKQIINSLDLKRIASSVCHYIPERR